MAIKRIFGAFPGFGVLAEIEGVNIIEVTPPTISTGTPSGTILHVGEFEDGAFDTPIEVFGGADLNDTFGGLGYTHDGSPHQSPIAVAAGGPELWNGNGFIALRNKKFSRLIVCRVDSSAGEVAFSRLACLTNTDKGPYDLTASGTLEFTRDGSVVITPTTTAVAGIVDGASGTFPTVFTGGETLQLKDEQGTLRVITFLAADQALADVITRINAVLGYTAASDNSSELRLTSRVTGSDGVMDVEGGTAVATLGLTTTDTAQLDTWTVNLQSDGVYTLRFITRDASTGLITTFDATHTSSSETTTQVKDALVAAINATALAVPITAVSTGSATFTTTADVAGVPYTPTVQAEPTPADVTFVATTPNVTSFGLGNGEVRNIDKVSAAELAAVIDAETGLSGQVTSEGFVRACNTVTPTTGTLQATGGTDLVAAGFTLLESADAAVATDVDIPAGTRLRDSVGLQDWVTMRTISTGTAGGPFTAKVRPLADVDTTPTSSIGNVTIIVDTLLDGFSVTNAAAITRKTPEQLDTAYQTALDATLDQSGISAEIDTSFGARTSEAIMQSLLNNALDATAQGHHARKTVTRPPLGTTVSDALNSTTIGVISLRNQRAFYCFPGFRTRIPEIARIGTSGGTGFTADGVIDVGADGFYASVRSILPPEENAGQNLDDTNVGALRVTGLESAFDSALGGVALSFENYKAFKRNGIIAPLVERDAITFQSDLTSVNPVTDPVRSSAKRRFFADFIINSVADIAGPYKGKLNKPSRRNALMATLNMFLEILKADENPDLSRLVTFAVIDITTDALRAIGHQNIQIQVQQHPSMDFINIFTEVGETVTVQEAA